MFLADALSCLRPLVRALMRPHCAAKVGNTRDDDDDDVLLCVIHQHVGQANTTHITTQDIYKRIQTNKGIS